MKGRTQHIPPPPPRCPVFLYNWEKKYLHNDVVDGNMNKLHEETNKSHYSKSNGRGHCNFLKFWKKKENDWELKQNICKNDANGIVHTETFDYSSNIKLGDSIGDEHTKKRLFRMINFSVLRKEWVSRRSIL